MSKLYFQLGAGLLVLGIAAGLFFGGRQVGVTYAELDCANATLALNAEAAERERTLQKKLDNIPKNQNSIRELIRENPSTCYVPKPVADGLRDSIRKSNAH